MEDCSEKKKTKDYVNGAQLVEDDFGNVGGSFWKKLKTTVMVLN